MLYETLSHPTLALIFLLVGIVGGLIFDVGNFIKFLFANKKIPAIIIDFIQTCVCLFIIFIVNVKVNYGIIRLFPYLLFLTSFFIERITIGKVIAKFYLKCYNLLTKLNSKLWSKLKNGKSNKGN